MQHVMSCELRRSQSLSKYALLCPAKPHPSRRIPDFYLQLFWSKVVKLIYVKAEKPIQISIQTNYIGR